MKLLKILNRLVDAVIIILLLLLSLYAGYCLWDNNQIYSAVDDIKIQLEAIKPQVPQSVDLADEEERLQYNESFTQLNEINPDICAWLTLDGTSIDYPVVQGSDNMSYLNKDIYGDYALSGSVFLDYRCGRNFDDDYALIYAHHMGKGKMFGDLDLYHDANFFKRNRTGVLMTPYKTYSITLLASMKVTASDQVVYMPQLYANNGADVVAYAEEKAENINRDVLEAYKKDSDAYKVLALTTCASDYSNARTVIITLLQE